MWAVLVKAFVKFAVGDGNTGEASVKFAVGDGNTGEAFVKFAVGDGNTGEGVVKFAVGDGNTGEAFVKFAVGDGNTGEAFVKFAVGDGNTGEAFVKFAVGGGNTGERTRPAPDSHARAGMIRSTIAILTLLLLSGAVGCRYEPPPAQPKRPELQTRTVWVRTDFTGKRVRQKVDLLPDVLSRCEAGSQLGPDGLVSQSASTFKTTDPIHLSMWIKESPEGLQLAMRVLDADDNEIGVARRDDAGGAKAVTMKVGEELEPGKYKLEGYWGGNLVCEKEVQVRE